MARPLLKLPQGIQMATKSLPGPQLQPHNIGNLSVFSFLSSTFLPRSSFLEQIMLNTSLCATSCLIRPQTHFVSVQILSSYSSCLLELRERLKKTEYLHYFSRGSYQLSASEDLFSGVFFVKLDYIPHTSPGRECHCLQTDTFFSYFFHLKTDMTPFFSGVGAGSSHSKTRTKLDRCPLKAHIHDTISTVCRAYLQDPRVTMHQVLSTTNLLRWVLNM